MKYRVLQLVDSLLIVTAAPGERLNIVSHEVVGGLSPGVKDRPGAAGSLLLVDGDGTLQADRGHGKEIC